ncbi:hypothetical protein [Citrobacter sedlakii]|uniref:hypothetical protein n=1 Tax=Citrobacter sedlakii TaxID=67826 RepID=UPI00333A4C0E
MRWSLGVLVSRVYFTGVEKAEKVVVANNALNNKAIFLGLIWGDKAGIFIDKFQYP